MGTTEPVAVQMHDGACLGADQVLRAMEDARRRWSLRQLGVPGMFAGFETLRLDVSKLAKSGRLTVITQSVEERTQSQLVEIKAVFKPSDAESETLIAIGRGCNLTPGMPVRS